MEHRCCIEFLNIQRKLVFDGSVEKLYCIIQHACELFLYKYFFAVLHYTLLETPLHYIN